MWVGEYPSGVGARAKHEKANCVGWAALSYVQAYWSSENFNYVSFSASKHSKWIKFHWRHRSCFKVKLITKFLYEFLKFYFQAENNAIYKSHEILIRCHQTTPLKCIYVAAKNRDKNYPSLENWVTVTPLWLPSNHISPIIQVSFNIIICDQIISENSPTTMEQKKCCRIATLRLLHLRNLLQDVFRFAHSSEWRGKLKTFFNPFMVSSIIFSNIFHMATKPEEPSTTKLSSLIIHSVFFLAFSLAHLLQPAHKTTEGRKKIVSRRTKTEQRRRDCTRARGKKKTT